jgi:glycerol-3-phosphate acyltransferase PlsY
VLAPQAAPLVALAVFVGHLYPVFHRFQGGKGVATAGGVLLGLDPWLGLGSIATWAIIAAFFRYASLAALIAALFAPFFAWFIKLNDPAVAVVAIIAALLIWRHWENIVRLAAGQETRIGEKKASPPQDPSAV